MAFTTTVSSKGGAKLKAVLAQAEKQRAKKIKVGFFSTSEYEDGTKVATVAAIQEYGLAGNPERPFFRQAIAELEQDLPKQLRGLVNPQTMTVDAATAARIGQFAVETIQARIRDLKQPPNAPSTVKRGDSPLVDTGEMLAAVDHEAV